MMENKTATDEATGEARHERERAIVDELHAALNVTTAALRSSAGPEERRNAAAFGNRILSKYREPDEDAHEWDDEDDWAEAVAGPPILPDDQMTERMKAHDWHVYEDPDVGDDFNDDITERE